MDLPELRDAAIAALTSAAAAIMDTDLSDTTPSDDWIVENRKALGGYFLTMVENIDQSPSGFDMGKWFDFFSIDERGQEDLQTAAHEAMIVYNEYVRRSS